MLEHDYSNKTQWKIYWAIKYKKKKKRSTHCCGYDYEGLDYATLQLNYNKNKTEAPTIVG